MAGALAYAGRNSDNYPSLYQVKGSKTLENAWYDYLTKDRFIMIILIFFFLRIFFISFGF